MEAAPPKSNENEAIYQQNYTWGAMTLAKKRFEDRLPWVIFFGQMFVSPTLSAYPSCRKLLRVHSWESMSSRSSLLFLSWSFIRGAGDSQWWFLLNLSAMANDNHCSLSLWVTNYFRWHPLLTILQALGLLREFALQFATPRLGKIMFLQSLPRFSEQPTLFIPQSTELHCALCTVWRR